jgi:hypothetical protein
VTTNNDATERPATPAAEADKMLGELRGLLAKATPGPWVQELVDDDTCAAVDCITSGDQVVVFTEHPNFNEPNGKRRDADVAANEADYELIVWLRNNADRLADVLARAAAADRLLAAADALHVAAGIATTEWSQGISSFHAPAHLCVAIGRLKLAANEARAALAALAAPQEPTK